MRSKKSQPAPFSANAAAQPVYKAISAAIGELSREQAMAVLEELLDNIDARLEALSQEMEEQDAGEQ